MRECKRYVAIVTKANSADVFFHDDIQDPSATTHWRKRHVAEPYGIFVWRRCTSAPAMMLV
jgi:hypothetical protein